MKRSLFVAVLIAALLGLLATPAYAAKKVQTSYPPTNIPIMVPPFGPGVWGINSGLTGHADQDMSLYQASDPTDLSTPYAPIPVNEPVIGCVGWLGSIYGQVKNVPKDIATTFIITGPDGFSQHFGPADTAPYWTGPHQWDQWWTEWLGGPPPELFNPKASAGVYFNHLYLPIGPFPKAGTYHLYFAMVQLKPVIDLIDWNGTGRATHYKPPALDWSTDFDFNVGP
jgi:hypothetical protein